MSVAIISVARATVEQKGMMITSAVNGLDYAFVPSVDYDGP